jgi:DNA replication initiation complex subunit (GINS family)
MSESAENKPKIHDLTTEEQQIIGPAVNACNSARAQAYQALKALEEAEKAVALADAAQQAVLFTISKLAGFTGQIRIDNNRIIGE